MKGEYIDLDSLSLEELSGVVSLYPWFGLARKKLCLRTATKDGIDDNQAAQAALYIGSGKILFEQLRQHSDEALTDDSVKDLLSKYASPRKVRAASGDFFSQREYDSVRKDSDNIFSSFAKQPHQEASEGVKPGDMAGFCTEPLAQIFLEQGYWEQARYIYSKLILLNPEKSTYFASLIEKIDQELNKQKI